MGTLALSSSTLPNIRKLCVSCRTRKTGIKNPGLASSLCTTISAPLAQRYYGSFGEIGATLHFETASFSDITACLSRPVISLSRSISKLQLEHSDSHLISVNIVSAPPVDSTRLSTFVDEGFSSLSTEISQEHVPYFPSTILSVEHLREDASSQSLPRGIGSYYIIGRLGNGTHGEVILVSPKENTNDNLYAVKVLRDVEEHDVIREVSILKRLREWSDSRTAQDAGIRFLQKLQEVFQNEHVHCLVLEYHPSTLSDSEVASRFRLINDRHSRLSMSVSLPVALDRCLTSSTPVEEAVQFVRFLIAELSLGLAFLHTRGFVHQDIKPANILISYTGHVVIGDFGATSKMPLFSSGYDKPSLDVEIRTYGPIVLDADSFVTFTPLYAAPEMKERTSCGQVIYDHRSDWWSLGILLYELVTGTVPFQQMVCSKYNLNGRRSDGDRSLTFGELETLSDRLKGQNITWYIGLDNFLRSLLSHNPEDRLSWPDVKEHEFLSPLRGLWEDIADLKHPPCPKPPTSRFHGETLSSMTDKDDVCGVISRPVTLSSHDAFLDGLPGTAHKASFNSDYFFQPSSSLLPLSLMATWEPQHPPVIHDRDSDGGSLPQAFPSTASIWAYGHTHNTSISESEVHDSGCDVCSHTLDDSSTVDKLTYTAATPYLPSLFSSTPVLKLDYQQRFGSRGSSYSPNSQYIESSVMDGDPIALEDITWSLIEAMDCRDQVPWERQQGRRTSCRKRISGIFRRILRRLFTR